MKPSIRWTHRLAGVGMLGFLASWIAASWMYATRHHPGIGLAWSAGCSLLAITVSLASEARRKP